MALRGKWRKENGGEVVDQWWSERGERCEGDCVWEGFEVRAGRGSDDGEVMGHVHWTGLEAWKRVMVMKKFSSSL